MAHDIGNTVTDVAYPLVFKIPERLQSKRRRKARTHIRKLPHKEALKLERKQYNKNKSKHERW